MCSLEIEMQVSTCMKCGFQQNSIYLKDGSSGGDDRHGLDGRDGGGREQRLVDGGGWFHVQRGSTDEPEDGHEANCAKGRHYSTKLNGCDSTLL